MKNYKDIDSYIASYPPEVQELLITLRKTIRKAAPKAKEAIKYGIPTYVGNGNLVHFGGFKTHVGFYPTSSGVWKFKKELSAYECSKGTVQFPFDAELPLRLIAKIVKYRVQEDMATAKEFKAKKK